eukprot:252157_1
MESDHTDEWEILSESTATEPVHIDDDNFSVHSLASSYSQSSSTVSSTVNVNIVGAHAASHVPSAFIPQINESKQLNRNSNELIPSYVDIESELQRQREVIHDLHSQLNNVSNERDQIRRERDDLKQRVDNHALEITRLRQRNVEIDRQNMTLREMQMRKRYSRRKLKKMRSKAVSITNKRGHRPTVPAKLRFRRQRTTHRSVYHQNRGW